MGLRREPFTFAATGDAIITRRLTPYEGVSDRFDDLVSVLRGADATVSQLEVVLPEDGSFPAPYRVVPDQYQYLAPMSGVLWRAEPAVLDELAAAGVDLFTAASNHAFDYAHPGIEATAAALRERELPLAGIGRNLFEARSPAYHDTPGGRVGLIHATTSVAPGSEAGEASAMLPGRPGVNPLHLRWIYSLPPERLDQLREIGRIAGVDDAKATWLARENPDWRDEDAYRFMHMAFEEAEDEASAGVSYEPFAPDREAILDRIADADANADWVVAGLHCHQGPGGTRNVPETPAFLRAFARACVDAGADVFVGTGPHVLRGIEVYGGKPIFYSLGNFVYQGETVSRLPPDSFDYYDLDETRDPGALFEARYHDDDGNPTGILAEDARWETVVPRCSFAGDGTLERVELYPCTLQGDQPRPQRGTPMLATPDHGASILDRLEELSAPSGTVIDREDDIGVVTP